MVALLFQLSQDQLAQQISSEPLWIQLAQLVFWATIALLIVGLPIFVWLAVRACRDLHAIRAALEFRNSYPHTAAALDELDKRPAMLSQFGRD